VLFKCILATIWQLRFGNNLKNLINQRLQDFLLLYWAFYFAWSMYHIRWCI